MGRRKGRVHCKNSEGVFFSCNVLANRKFRILKSGIEEIFERNGGV